MSFNNTRRNERYHNDPEYRKKILDSNKKSREKNKEKYNQYHNKYVENNKDKLIKQSREYYLKRKEEGTLKKYSDFYTKEECLYIQNMHTIAFRRKKDNNLVSELHYGLELRE